MPWLSWTIVKMCCWREPLLRTLIVCVSYTLTCCTPQSANLFSWEYHQAALSKLFTTVSQPIARIFSKAYSLSSAAKISRPPLNFSENWKSAWLTYQSIKTKARFWLLWRLAFRVRTVISRISVPLWRSSNPMTKLTASNTKQALAWDWY